MLSKLCINSLRFSHNSIKAVKNFRSTLNLARKNLFRQFSTSSIRSAMSKNVKEHKYRAQDRVSEAFTLIYKAPLEYYLSACNHITTITCLGIALFIGIRYHSGEQMRHFEQINYGGKLISDETELYYFAIGFVVINLALRVMVHRYPLRIYKNNNQYLAIFESQIPTKKVKVEFMKGQVLSRPETGVLPWRDSRYKINNRNVLLLVDYFKSPSELFEMMDK